MHIKGRFKAHQTTQPDCLKKILSGPQDFGLSMCVRVCSYFHDAVPVVPCGHPKQCEEGHSEILKGGVSAQALAGVVHVAL